MANKLQALLGGGAVNQAANAMQSRAYQIHVKEMESLGQKPLTPQEWAKQQ